MPGLSLKKFLNWAITYTYQKNGTGRLTISETYTKDGIARLNATLNYIKTGQARLQKSTSFTKNGEARLRLIPYPRSSYLLLTDTISAENIKPALEIISNIKEPVLDAKHPKPKLEKIGHEGF